MSPFGKTPLLRCRCAFAWAIAAASGVPPLVSGCLGDGGEDIPGPEGGTSKEGGEGGTHGDGGATATGDGGKVGDGGKSGEGGTGSTVASLRVANLSPDSPVVDFCIAPHGTSAFQGPLLQAFASSLKLADAGTPGVGLGQLLGGDASTGGQMASAYFRVNPNTMGYDARVVVAGATDCSTGIATATALPTLAGAGYATIALVGEAQPVGGGQALKIVGFTDDVLITVPDGGSANLHLRFVNAAPGVSGAVSLQVDGMTLFSGVSFGQAGAGGDGGPSVDSHGYASRGSLTGSKLAVLASGKTLATGTISAAAGATITIALVGASSSGNTPPLRLLECVDNSGTTGMFGSCNLL